MNPARREYRSSSPTPVNDSQRWQLTADRYRSGRQMDPVLADHFRRVYVDLVRRWIQPGTQGLILKTDVFAEATCPSRAFSWELAGAGELVYVDISTRLTRQARAHAASLGYGDSVYTVADVRHLPFATDTFDLVVSDSTLDHFGNRADIHVALRELARVLRPGGTLVITLDNPRNVTQPLLSLWLRLGLAPYFIGATLSRKELETALADMHLDVIQSAVILHQARFFTKAALRLMRATKVPGGERLARAGLALSERHARWPSCELTGLFVAACAVKTPR